MKIAVLVKYYKGELGPFDEAALECALECEAEVTVVTMSPKSVLPALENLTRLGTKAILISDSVYAGSDTMATSYVLSEALRKIAPDVIFAGRQSIDGDTSQVPPMIAERLGFDVVPYVMEFNTGSTVTRSGKISPLKKNTVFTFERIRTLRFPSIFSKKGIAEIWDNKTLALDVKRCGLGGSPTRVVRSYESSVGRRDCNFFSPSDFDRLIKESLSKESKHDSAEIADKAEKIYYVGDICDMAERFAHDAVKLDVGGKEAREVAEELSSLGAEIVLFESNEEYKTLAARIAVITGSGLCADCISFRREGESFIMTRPALGGNITADIVCTSKLSLATVRKKGASERDLIFAIGRGAADFVEEIRALAKKYGASIAASRPLADDGTLPYECQVGLTGKTVSPRVYVAFGISGAVQHTSAISGAGTVIAVNTDRGARIFDYSDYGTVTDIKNLLKEL